MANLIRTKIGRATLDEDTPAHHQPLSLPKVLSRYNQLATHHDWEALLTGVRLNPDQGEAVPPSLDLGRSEYDFLASRPVPHVLGRAFDVDSVLFSPTSLGVFRRDVHYCFMPPFLRSAQRNPYINIPGLQITKHKCILVCVESQWSCMAFFPLLPLTYENEAGEARMAQTQHLDDHALRVWTEQVVLKAFDSVCGNSRRHDYPISFDEIKTKSTAKREILQGREQGSYTQMDLRIRVSAALLAPLWARMVELAATVLDARLPSNAFSNPILFVFSHNLKESSMKTPSFAETRTAFLRDFGTRWDAAHLARNLFWLDFGQETYSDQPGTTLLRKAACNAAWAEQLGPRANVVSYPWALTDAGSVTVEARPGNPMRDAGFFQAKAYNKIKEQFATPLKGHVLFSNPTFELLAYAESMLKTVAIKLNKSNLPATLPLATTLDQLQSCKQRAFAGLTSTDHCSYAERQEFRVLLDAYEQLPAELMTSEALDRLRDGNGNGDNAHRAFWILSTADVNAFRIAECNRWILCLEHVIQAAKFEEGTQRQLPVAAQELNSRMSTAMARILNMSLGCLNPVPIPSIWRGKYWTRGRQPKRRDNGWQKRRGLELKESVAANGMAWLPYRLGSWSDDTPFFRARYLDVSFNALTGDKRGRAHLNDRISNARLREYVERQLAALKQSRRETIVEEAEGLFAVLAQMAIQAYNCAVLALVRRRWRKHHGIRKNRPDDWDRRVGARMREGLENLSYQSLKRLLRNLEMDKAHPTCTLQRAYVKAEHSDTFADWEQGTWLARVRPLFAPTTAASPPWLKKAPYNKKTAEIRATIASVFPPPDYDDTFLCVFEDQLERALVLHLHAALHYDRSKEATMRKAHPGSHSSATLAKLKDASELQRTQWIFPALRHEDLPWPPQDPASRRRQPYRRALRRMMVLQVGDQNSKVDRLMRSPNLLYRRAATHLAKLEAFNEQEQEYAAEEADNDRLAAEDSDWPPMPDAADADDDADELDSSAEQL